MHQSKEQQWVIIGLILTGFVLSVVTFLTEIPAGGADNYAHFNISRWAFRYPHLFLDHWGKPVFTILTAPFALLGMEAVRIFNVVAGMVTAWFCYRLVSHFNLKAAWFAPVLAVFTPIYFVMMSTAMTEILFSLLLVVAVYLFFKEKYIPSAIAISFLFLVRSEGLAFVVFFLAGFLIRKKYRAIPFLLTGFVLFSFIGWIYHYHDFLWLINKRPYSTGAANVYGSGEWFYYLMRMPRYYGPVLPFFLVAGTFVILLRWIKTNFKLNSGSFLFLLLVLGSFWGYLFIHSFLWWKGDTSAGLLRVMAGVAPLSGVIAAFAVNSFSEWVDRKNKVLLLLLSFISIYFAGAAGNYYNRSVSTNATTELLEKTTQFLDKPEFREHKLVVHNPYFAYSTGRDAWDFNEIQYGFSDRTNPGAGLPDSTLFVWDAHFSANEGGMPIDMIMSNQDFKLIKHFEPEIPFLVLGGNPYQILVFRKESGSRFDNHNILQELQLKGIEQGTGYTEEFTFENPFQETEQEKRRILKDETASGYAYTLEGAEFSPAFHIPVQKVINEGYTRLRATIEVMAGGQADAGKLLIVFSVEDISQVYHYTTFDFSKQIAGFDVWSETEFLYTIPSKLNKNATLKVYLWNINRSKIVIDNFKIEIFRHLNE